MADPYRRTPKTETREGGKLGLIRTWWVNLKGACGHEALLWPEMACWSPCLCLSGEAKGPHVRATRYAWPPIILLFLFFLLSHLGAGVFDTSILALEGLFVLESEQATIAQHVSTRQAGHRAQ